MENKQNAQDQNALSEMGLSENENGTSQTLVIQATSRAEQISIKPSIAESERFISFLNDRFSLGIDNDLLISIEETSPNFKGFFRSVKCSKIWNATSQEGLAFKQQNEPSEKDAKPINSIVLSSHTLKNTPYETLTHELAHYIDFKKTGKGSKNNYHTQAFKVQAEKLLLRVERGKYGFNQTSETPEFIQMLKEFSPSPNAFKIFQNTQDRKTKTKSRLLKFGCSCGCIIRTAKNENKPLNAICLYCETPFKEVCDD